MHRTIKAFLPTMLTKGGGSIINMSSGVSSIKGLPNRYAYGASKAAVIGLTKAVAIDFITKGIRCNAICPGTIVSPSFEDRVKTVSKQTGRPPQRRARQFYQTPTPEAARYRSRGGGARGLLGLG
jgi:2-keto-3-deoxy-L-fuconate dehydrogenase